MTPDGGEAHPEPNEEFFFVRVIYELQSSSASAKRTNALEPVSTSHVRRRYLAAIIFENAAGSGAVGRLCSDKRARHLAPAQHGLAAAHYFAWKSDCQSDHAEKSKLGNVGYRST